MVYNNIFLRILFSTIFILVYFLCLYINFQFVFYLIFLIYFFTFIEIYIYFNKYKLIPLIYILISLIFFINIDFNKDIFLNFNLFILTVITFDIFSYIIGKIFGRKKLTKISPNKTYEGLIGGMLISFFISLLFSLILKIFINIELLIFIFFIILSSFVGDIIESYFKRKNNIKNSSEFIPGHGGVFDRFDSFLFSIIFYSISIKFLI
tara:strand:+ start:395 stop:1018 length:624 start_codon:yes stop_codon:yes gene_type:complete